MDAYRELISMSALPVNYSFRSTKQEGQIIAHPHWHEAVEVLYINQGQAMQQLDGVQFPLAEKDIVIIWKNQIHSTISLPGSTCEIQVFQLSYPDVAELVPPLHFYAPVRNTDPMYAQIYQIISHLSEELKRKETAYEYLVKAAVYQLYAVVIRNLALLPADLNRPSSLKEPVMKAFHYLEENYASPITLPDAARSVHLSVAQFMRIFKQATGMTYKQYLNFYRIEKSTELLRQGQSVTETAFACGFSNVNTFIRLFRKFKSSTPAQFAQKRN